MVGSFYLAPSYGEVARSFYVFVMLPALIALPYWLPRAGLFSWSWLIFLLPIAYLAVSVFWVDENHISSERSQWYFFKPFLFLILLLLAVQRVLRVYPKVDDYLLKFVTVVALISGVISLWHYLPAAIELDKWPRMAGMSANHDINVTAALFGLNIVFCIFGFAKWSKGWRWPLLVSLLLSLIIVLLTRSKVPLFYFVASIVWWFVHSVKQKKIVAVILVSLVLLSIAGSVFYYFDRVPFLDRATSYSIRLKFWQSVIEQLKTDIWFGFGIGSNIQFEYMGKAYYSHAHNFIVDTIRYGGVVGAVLLSAQVIFVAVKGLILVRHNSSLLPLIAWFFMGVFFLLTNGQQPLVKPHHIWFFYWLPLVLIVGKTALPRVTPTKPI